MCLSICAHQSDVVLSRCLSWCVFCLHTQRFEEYNRHMRRIFPGSQHSTATEQSQEASTVTEPRPHKAPTYSINLTFTPQNSFAGLNATTNQTTDGLKLCNSKKKMDRAGRTTGQHKTADKQQRRISKSLGLRSMVVAVPDSTTGHQHTSGGSSTDPASLALNTHMRQ